jgi:D-serine ammonia-lyase
MTTKENLRRRFVGKTLIDVGTPSAILDLSKIWRNCAGILEDIDALQLGWRAHIKSHKVLSLIYFLL